jgi:hypothetical protein
MGPLPIIKTDLILVSLGMFAVCINCPKLEKKVKNYKRCVKSFKQLKKIRLLYKEGPIKQPE